MFPRTWYDPLLDKREAPERVLTEHIDAPKERAVGRLRRHLGHAVIGLGRLIAAEHPVSSAKKPRISSGAYASTPVRPNVASGSAARSLSIFSIEPRRLCDRCVPVMPAASSAFRVFDNSAMAAS